MARTLIHEAFHAYLTFEYSYNSFTSTKYGDLVAEFAKDYSNSFNNTEQHRFLVEEMIVDHIATALYDFALNEGIPVDYEYCKKMSWAGLEDTDLFATLPNQEEIRNIIRAELDKPGKLDYRVATLDDKIKKKHSGSMFNLLDMLAINGAEDELFGEGNCEIIPVINEEIYKIHGKRLKGETTRDEYCVVTYGYYQDCTTYGGTYEICGPVYTEVISVSCYDSGSGGGTTYSDQPPCELCPNGGGGSTTNTNDESTFNCLLGDPEDKVCYDGLAANPLFKCIYEALESLNEFNSLMSGFTGNTMVDLEWKLVPQATSRGKNVDASTKLEWPGATSNLVVEITEDRVASFGPIYIALTLLHEAVHADIKRQLILNNSGLLNASDEHSSNEIWDAYIVYNYGNNATSDEHEFMINRYIGKLGGALYDFASQNFPSEWVLSRSKYESFAYQGLTGTNTWNNEMSEFAKNTIRDDIQYVINHSFQECTN